MIICPHCKKENDLFFGCVGPFHLHCVGPHNRKLRVRLSRRWRKARYARSVRSLAKHEKNRQYPR